MMIHQARRRPTAGAVRAPYDVRTVLVRRPHDCTYRTVIVGIARASCDFIGVQIFQNRTAPVRCCLLWIYRLRCLRRIAGI